MKRIGAALLLLAAGGAIYATCRQEVIFLDSLRGTKLLEWIKVDVPHQHRNIFTYFLLFCLPDMLWYSALLLLQRAFYRQKITASKMLFWLAAALPFMLELMQYLGVLRGTFDIVDVACYVFTLLTFIILWKRKKLSLPSS